MEKCFWIWFSGCIRYRTERPALYIVGRLKRFIKVSGHRISLDEIDEKIMSDMNIYSVSSGIDDHLVVFVTEEREKDLVKDYIYR